MDNIKEFIGSIYLTVSEAMQQIDKNSCGILFVTDEQNRLFGCLTDGDIRRYLLSGGKMLFLYYPDMPALLFLNDEHLRSIWQRSEYLPQQDQSLSLRD